MPTHFSAMRTPGGHLCGEVTSAFQKSIRRSLEHESLYWATELDLAGYGAYCFKRMRAIASEDIGMADPNVVVQIRALYENWVEARKGKVPVGAEGGDDPHSQGRWVPGARLFYIQSVIILARAPKSRIIDHAVMTYYEGQRPQMEMPDWALDLHTNQGRSMGRNQDHFFDEGARLANWDDTPVMYDPYEESGRIARTGGFPSRHRQEDEAPLTLIDE